MGNSTASAEAPLADIFSDIPIAAYADFSPFEHDALSERHAVMARALRRPLERRAATLCADPPPICASMMRALRPTARGSCCRARRPAPRSKVEINAGTIGIDRPFLVVIVSGNLHIYGARMGSVPCAWSIEGDSDMARILSRRASGRDIPRIGREKSMSKRTRESREKKILASLGRGRAGPVVECVGSGYLPPQQVDTC